MSRPTHQHRPGIIDLITLTLGVSLALAVYRGILPAYYLVMPASWQTRVLIYLGGMSLAFGLIFTGNLALARRWSRGDGLSPWLPGHWLLLLGGLASLADLLALAAFFARARTGPEPDSDPEVFRVFEQLTRYPYLPGLTHQIVGWGLGGIFALLLLNAAWPTVRTAWGLTFLAFTGFALLFAAAALAAIVELWAYERPGLVFNGYFQWGIASYRAANLGCLAMLLHAVVRDRRQHPGLDWLHWSGVTAWLVMALVQATLCQ